VTARELRRDAKPVNEPRDDLKGPAARRLFTLPLHRRDSIGSAYHVLTFDAPEPIVAAPGQFAMVRSATWGDAPLLPRPMSLLTAGARPSILIKVVGEGTASMAHASSGEPFHLLAPLGQPWSRCPADHTVVLVAGGVGVAPLVYLARDLVERASAAGAAAPRRMIALYGARTHHDLPLHEELSGVTDLRIATEDGSRGARGRVTVLLEQALRELAGEKVKIYACGPDRMMAAVAKLCAAQSVACEVSLETPMACGYGVCLGCPVPRATGGFLYACTEGPCVDAAKIAWDDPAPHPAAGAPPRGGP
jgi:dihydroorotate dehydrogenase electron transfer subunit